MDIKLGPDNASHFIKIGSIGKLTTFAIRKAWFGVGKDLIADATREIKKKLRKGRVYTIRSRGGRARRHVASLPGESHANLTGGLLKSLSWKVHGPDLQFGYGVIEKDAPQYAEWVENGTGRMAARPTLKIAIKKNIGNAEQKLAEAVMQGFN